MYQQLSNSVCVFILRKVQLGALEVCEEFLGFSSIPTIGTEDICNCRAFKCLWFDYGQVRWEGV